MGVSEYHRQRRNEILRHHPEVRALMGPRPATVVSTAGVLAVQFAIAALLGGRPWWWALLAAFFVGAFLAHYLNVVIHEATHNLIFRKTAANKAASIFANLASVIPSAIGFRHYHRLHHASLGQHGMDADVAPAWEAALIGRGRLGKLFWLFIQPITYAALHPALVARRLPIDVWFIANVVLVLGATAAMGWGFGASAVIYLLASTYLSVGPHPTGAHILQEHINFEGQYVTASYDGPINALSMNFGLHVEHHDLPSIPGPRLKALHRLAPTYYADGFRHRSRWSVLWRFVTDPQVGLDTRMVHPR
jgi:sphingolipid delta-4 desaturase